MAKSSKAVTVRGSSRAADKQRQNSGKRKRTRTSFGKGNPFRWQEGQSGNPAGRPKAITLSEAYRRALAIELDDGRTVAEAIAESVAHKAMAGTTMAAVEIADRTEGKARQPIDLNLSDLFKKAKEEYGIDPASDPILSAIFGAAGVGPDGAGAATGADRPEEAGGAGVAGGDESPQP